MSVGYVAAGVGGAILLSELGGDAPAPDPNIGLSAQANAKVAADTLQWYKDKDVENKPFRDEATQIALSQARAQAGTAAEQRTRDNETYAYTKDTFRPLEQKIASDAMGYDTQARRDAEAAQVQADIGTATDAARENMARDVQSRGGDVNSGNYTASLANMAVREAAAKAGAGNQARKNVETVGAAKLADAANLGRGIATSNATTTQLGLNAGNSATGNAQVPLNIDATRGAQYAQGANTAISGNQSSANILLGQYNAQTNAEAQANSTMNALLGAGGQAAGAYLARSDKNSKKDKKPASGKKAMDAVRLTDVKNWRYKKGAVAGDDGEQHTGPMAQDVRKNMGEATAPGGKVIDLVSMNGITLAAVKDIDKRLQRLEGSKKRQTA